MRTPLNRLAGLCSGALLLACSPMAQRASPPSLALAGAEQHYLVGRSAHLAGRHALALSAYQSALLADPEHVNARNGLATLHAEQGALDQAIPLWRMLTARASGPESAFLFSNLGHAHYLNGDYASALAALEQACLLDPLSPRAWQHLGAALDKLGQHGRARLMARQAALLQAHDVKADYAVTDAAAVPAIDKALRASAARPSAWGATELHQGADGVYELQRSLPGMPTAVPAPRISLEIRNGNGVPGLARSLATQMDPASVRVVRLSNQKGFRVQATRIEFRPPFRAAAQQLAERFGRVPVVAAGKGRTTDLRLVLGRDLARENFALRPVRPGAPASFVEHQIRAGTARDNEAHRSTTTGAQP